VSPRKSSTSSGNPTPRPRYLAVEVAGDQPLSPRWLESVLFDRLGENGPRSGRMRVIRVEGHKALVEVPHRVAPTARAAWNGNWTTARGERVGATTHRTFGTLVKGKAWIRARFRVPTRRLRA
jgi:RNase P/RNase MRP subunit POP5